MEFNCKTRSSYLTKYCGYCCAYKKELLRNNNFEKNIDILPRVIICKSLEKCVTYCQSLEIRNLGTITRRIQFFVDPNSDVSFKTKGSNDLIAGCSTTVDVYVEPNQKKDLNRPRYFYVLTEHPDIVFEVPIIVIKKPPEVFVPSSLCLHKVPSNTVTHYQFIIYNPFECELSFNTCSTHENITFSQSESVIPASGFCKLLLTAKIPSQAVTVSLVVVVNGKCHRILVHMEPSDRIIHLSSSAIIFDDVYMGLKQQKSLYICNKSLEDVSFHWTTCTNPPPSDMLSHSEELSLNSILTIKNMRGCISPLNSALSIITFCPSNANVTEEEEPPFKVNYTIYLCCPLINSKFYQLHVMGTILGPDIDVNPRDTDFGNMYMGQIQCLSLVVTNKGPIDGEVYLKNCTDPTDFRWTTAPDSHSLKPGETRVFALRFYRRNLGKFLTKLTFKIKRGNEIPILLRGNSMPAQVKIWPDSFEFGEIPICVPQKRFALIANPLPVSIVVEPSVVNEGTDDPLILSVNQTKLPLHTRPAPLCDGERIPPEDEEGGMRPRYSDFELGKKSDFVEAKNSDLSWHFAVKVLDDIPAMADELLKNLKLLTPQFHSEPGMKIVDAALDGILSRSDYFDELKENQNFMNLSWESLPENPKEIAIENERFYLKPNESKSFPVILVPNLTGPNVRTIQFRCCPLGMDQSDMKTAINSSDMQNVLQLQYNCIAPSIVYKREIDLHQPILVDKPTSFEMHFENNQQAAGFVCFNSLADSIAGSLCVAESHKKFFIRSGETVTVPATVTYHQTGNVALAGIFQVLGRSAGCTFTVTADVLPPKLLITPAKLIKKQPVLQCTRARVFFENITTTIAKFSVTLKNDKIQQLEPLGGHLAPGQKILISVFSRFLDPGIYKNVVMLHLMHAERISIPLQFIVEGIPIIFEPNIQLGFDCGTVFRSERNREYPINITNAGQKTYRLAFVKQKPRGHGIASPVVFDVQPHGITMNPKESRSIRILLDTSKEIKAEELYSVDGLGEDNARYKFFNFSCKCDVIQSKIVWSKPEVRLDSMDKLSDAAAITNSTPLQVSVSLCTSGLFSLIDVDTMKTSKSLSFKLEGRAVRKFLIELNRSEVDGRGVCQCFEGSVKCKVNGKQQETLRLYAKINNPGIKICDPNVTFFAQNIQAYAHVSLRNDGSLPAKFCWNNVSAQICQTAFDDACERACAKTISEVVFCLPVEFVPAIPKAVNTSPDGRITDAAESDDDEEPLILDEESMLRDSPSIYANSKLKSNSFEGTEKPPSSSRKPKSCKEPNISDTFRQDPEMWEKDSKHLKNVVIGGPPEPPADCKKLLQFPSPLSSDEVGIEQILDYLGLPRPKQKKASVEFELNAGANVDQLNEYAHGDQDKSDVEFQNKQGLILPKAIQKAYVFLPCIPKGYSFLGKYRLEVEGGECETLDLKVTNQKCRIQVSQTNIDISRQLWCKTCSYKFELNNPCPFAIKIKIVEGNDKGDLSDQLINGSVKVTVRESCIMMPQEKSIFNCQVILGLEYNFMEDIGVEVNNSTTGVPIRFHGSGLMPMVLPSIGSNMPYKSVDTVASYLTMRSVYEKVKKSKQEFLNKEHISRSVTVSEEDESGMSNFSEPQARRRPSGFVALHYSDEIGPRALEIERLIETCKFIAQLRESEHLKQHFHQYYCKCMQMDVVDFDPVINLKLTICRPVPWEVSAYVLNMGDMVLNKTKHFRINLTFLGPGRVFLSARTRIAIPGLTAWFDDCYSVDYPDSFVFYLQSPDESEQRLYRNMNERDADECIKVTRAHACDINSNGVDKRENRSSRRPKIKEHYNKISFPSKTIKSPLILAEVCQAADGDWHNSTFQLVILFTALGGCFEIDQTIEDYLLIDVHLGPTLPIQLRGRVTGVSSSEL